MSLLLGLYGGYSNNSQVKADNKNINQSKNQVPSKFTQLSENNNWLALCKLWKKLSKLDNEYNPRKSWSIFEVLRTDYAGVNGWVSSLESVHLISLDEGRFIRDIFHDRFSYLEFRNGVVKCYDTSLSFNQIVQTRDDLENRYDILEKLFNENKINSETLSITKNKIIEDLNAIGHGSSDKENNKQFADLLIYLNQ